LPACSPGACYSALVIGFCTRRPWSCAM
jgi:hypothetical protein